MRRGFTLIEMLVSTALVMLIMLLFARIFEEAIGTVRSQRALIANDERARAFTQTLRGDLNNSTYRTSVGRGATAKIRVPGVVELVESPTGIVSLSPGDRPDPRQRGFIYISENDTNDEGDDILHLTVAIDETLRNALISDPGVAPYQGRAGTPPLATVNDLNQPDFDDGVLNGAGGSRAAEVCWFLRGTTLYRSVKMLRDPLPSGSPPFGPQPSQAGTGTPLMTTYTPFYRDFDYSATNNGQLLFHGLESLDNSQGLANSPLADPRTRFGHRPLKGQPDDGQPREFDNAGRYFGRFSQEETSHTGFQWPGIDAAAGSNMVDSRLVVAPSGIVAFDANADDTFDGGDTLLQGSRAGEDILLTGVETFDIDFWDPGYGESDFDGDGAWTAFDPDDDLNMNGIQDGGIWVELGNNLGVGMFTQSWTALTGALGNNTWGRQNPAYGPAGPAGNNVFDTWHPSLGAAAPYRPLQVAPGNSLVFNWTAATPPPSGAGSIIFPDAGQAPPNFSIGYVALNAGTTGTRVPEWPREPGAMVRDGGVTWQCFDNRIGLEKIRITIRFRDPASGLARQVTLIHSFVE